MVVLYYLNCVRYLITGANDNHFYGFAVGTPTAASGISSNKTEFVHFVAMDTESPLDVAYMSPAQVRWHEQELAAAKNAEWVVAYGHRPLYCSNHGGQVRRTLFICPSCAIENFN